MRGDRLIFSANMAKGYDYLRERVRSTADGRLVGRGAQMLLRECLSSGARHVYSDLIDPGVGALTEFGPRRPAKDRLFQLHQMSFEVRDRRPPGRSNHRFVRSFPMLAPPAIRPARPEHSPNDADIRWLLDPRNRQLMLILLPFQGRIPSVAIDIFREGLERLRRVNEGGTAIALANNRPYLRAFDDATDL